ncbi:formin-like protein 5 isoform X2 [Iris pallida]|uniref:Formin-like protein 5 isoform X2 n=1 Tax=Iris pallida TaxID=29817 RepID=A0AAX6EAY8_IRIPA|nr:formin-like protein 5 isoform X2 [Iris pallida]
MRFPDFSEIIRWIGIIFCGVGIILVDILWTILGWKLFAGICDAFSSFGFVPE